MPKLRSPKLRHLWKKPSGLLCVRIKVPLELRHLYAGEFVVRSLGAHELTPEVSKLKDVLVADITSTFVKQKALTRAAAVLRPQAPEDPQAHAYATWKSEQDNALSYAYMDRAEAAHERGDHQEADTYRRLADAASGSPKLSIVLAEALEDSDHAPASKRRWLAAIRAVDDKLSLDSTRQEFNRVLTEIARSKSASTARGTKDAIRMALRHAGRPLDVLSDVRIKERRDKDQREEFTQHQLAALLTEPRRELRVLPRLLCGTGLRISEAYSAKIDLSQKLVTVSNGKTASAKRVVPIAEDLVGTAEEWLAIRGTAKIKTITNALGEFIADKATSDPDGNWKPRLTTAHAARHWFTGRLVEAGAADHEIEELLGHAKTHFSRRTYNRVGVPITRLRELVNKIVLP